MSSYEDHKETESIFGHDYKGRKEIPVYSYLTRYFPKALVAIVRVCVAGNKQHNKDLDPIDIHWARDKSTDQLNTALRHIMDHGTMGPLDDDGEYHLAKAAWRINAALELQIEADKAAKKIPKIGIRDASQPLPADLEVSKCRCGWRLFTTRPGDLPPTVIDAAGKSHSVAVCRV